MKIDGSTEGGIILKLFKLAFHLIHTFLPRRATSLVSKSQANYLQKNQRCPLFKKYIFLAGTIQLQSTDWFNSIGSSPVKIHYNFRYTTQAGLKWMSICFFEGCLLTVIAFTSKKFVRNSSSTYLTERYGKWKTTFRDKSSKTRMKFIK